MGSHTLNDAFWHKAQRSLVGSRVMDNPAGFAKHGSHIKMLTATAINYSIADTGLIYTLAITAAIETATGTAAHANNPTKTVTDDGDPSERTLRKIVAAESIAAGLTWYVVATVDAGGSIRLYRGEAVATSQTPKRPELDLSAECAFGQVLMVNATNAFIYGTTAHNATGVTATFSDIAFIPQD